MSADVVGYSRLMGLDETGTVRILREHRAVSSEWKGIAVAEAGRNAVFAVWLARAGLTGPAPIFEGKPVCFNRLLDPTPQFRTLLEDVCVLRLNHDPVVTELLDLFDTSLLVGRIRWRGC